MELVTSLQIAELAGVKKWTNQYAANLMKNHADFPRPIIEQKGGGKSYWIKTEIIAWLTKDAAKPKTPTGRHAAKVYAIQRDSLDLSLAQQFIRSHSTTLPRG